jgi:hypothetical protein
LLLPATILDYRSTAYHCAAAICHCLCGCRTDLRSSILQKLSPVRRLGPWVLGFIDIAAISFLSGEASSLHLASGPRRAGRGTWDKGKSACLSPLHCFSWRSLGSTWLSPRSPVFRSSSFGFGFGFGCARWRGGGGLSVKRRERGSGRSGCVITSLCKWVAPFRVPRGGRRVATALPLHSPACTPSSISRPPRPACIWSVQRGARPTFCRCVSCALCENLRAPNRTPHPSRCALPAARCLHL